MTTVQIFKLKLIWTSCLVCFVGFTAVESKAYYGRESTEALLTFDQRVDVAMDPAPRLSDLQRPGPIQEAAKKLVNDQILHLDGVFHSAAFADKKKWGGPASCGPWYQPNNYDLKFTKVAPGTSLGRVMLFYSFKGKIVVWKEPLRNSLSKDIPLWLPLSPDLIYDVEGVKWGKNQCTDLEDNAKDSFYYYWNPWQNHCELSGKNSNQVIWFNGRVEKLPSTRWTYPDYDELYKTNEQNPTVNVSVFVGYLSHHVKAARPYYADQGYAALQNLSTALTEQAGFSLTEEHKKLYVDSSGKVQYDEGKNVQRIFEKTISRNGSNVKVKVSVLLADTALENQVQDPTFKYFVLKAFKQSDIMVYDGHSGDGDNLSPQKLGLDRLPKKHQIIFINGCDSYMNYLGQYQSFLHLKDGGIGKLNLVLSSTPTWTGNPAQNEFEFLRSFLDLKTQSYQKILDRLEKSNDIVEKKTGKRATYLVGVYGDEKNTYKRDQVDSAE